MSSHLKSKGHIKKATIKRITAIAQLPSDLISSIGDFMDVLPEVIFHPTLIALHEERDSLNG